MNSFYDCMAWYWRGQTFDMCFRLNIKHNTQQLPRHIEFTSSFQRYHQQSLISIIHYYLGGWIECAKYISLRLCSMRACVCVCQIVCLHRKFKSKVSLLEICFKVFHFHFCHWQFHHRQISNSYSHGTFLWQRTLNIVQVFLSLYAIYISFYI